VTDTREHQLDVPDVDVTVVFPVYNETGHLREELDRTRRALDASEYSFELIVVDDGSTDDSLAELADLDGLRVIRFATNRGSGSARRVGTQWARGRVVVWTDADMSYPNDDIPRLVKELDGYDQVVGARRTEQGSMKIVRVPAKWSIRRLASYLVEQPIPDLNSGFRAFRRDVAEQFLHVLPAGFSCVSTMTLSFLANGYSVKYVDIDYQARVGRSKFHPWRDTKSYLTQVVRMVLSYNPLRIFMPIALFLGALGLAKLGYDWVTRDFRLATNTLLVLLAALQILAIGLVADLVVRVTRPQLRVDPAGLTRG
jgi:glycosyltransferase involved in cell wall biosynthesis